MPVRAVRSAAKYRSDSAVRNAPTLAQQGARPKNQTIFQTEKDSYSYI
ncbi:MAG: hypothetical protein NZ519_13080 [Bacteroidia bacterium]|nr:hypothetical protein [Bacteroidia bacterium]